VTPLATEAWPAVFGGLIPVIGFGAAGYLIYRATREPPEGEKRDEGGDGGPPEPPSP
jgi:hypothetical protein